MAKIAIDSDGWIVGGPAVNVTVPENGKTAEYDGYKNIEPRDPSKVEKAWYYNGGNPELRETGNTPPSTTEERVENLEKAAGVNGTGKQGIAQRIDELEQRVSDLENSS